MVASGRGVAALPRWLVREYSHAIEVAAVRLGRHGIKKHIYVGVREEDLAIDYIRGFIEQARQHAGMRPGRRR